MLDSHVAKRSVFVVTFCDPFVECFNLFVYVFGNVYFIPVSGFKVI